MRVATWSNFQRAPIGVCSSEQPQKLIKTLSELGISPRDLAAGPQRLHLLQLRSLLTANLVPKELHQELERRLAEIKTEVVCDIPDTIRASLRPYQIAGFHFLVYLSSNRFGGILADDMGLGKTIQTLTWIAWLRNTDHHIRPKPDCLS